MKSMLISGMMLGGYTVAIGKGKSCYYVEVRSYGNYECKGGLRTLEEARKVYREELEEIKAEVMWSRGGL